jgi:hypothetical protein
MMGWHGRRQLRVLRVDHGRCLLVSELHRRLLQVDHHWLVRDAGQSVPVGRLIGLHVCLIVLEEEIIQHRIQQRLQKAVELAVGAGILAGHGNSIARVVDLRGKVAGGMVVE